MERTSKKYIWFNKEDLLFIRAMMEYFINEKKYIDGFVTDSPECRDVYLFNKRIIDITEINWKNSIIFSKDKLNKYPPVQNMIFDDHIRKDILDSKVLIDEKECFAIQNIGWMREIIKDKKIFIYGYSERGRRIAEIYELLDFCIEGFIDNELCDEKEDKRIISVEELAYEDNIYVLMDRVSYRKNIEKLADLGILMFKNLAIDNPFGTWYLGIGNQVLDINLGHSFVGKQGVCGFDVLGSCESSAFKIVILGGSTTDGTLFPFMSWPELLLDNIGHLNVTIYNGGVVGYTSTQELIKLLRDVMYLNPDMVIVYDGFNDMAAADKNPFAFPDVQRAMDYVNTNKDKIWLDIFAEGVMAYSGIQPDADKFDIWLSNIKRMKGVCESEGIQFFAFHQPILYSKLNISKEEKGLLWTTWRINDCYRWANEFRNRIKAIADTYDYIYDLSDIFDNETDIYMEDCHVYEKGNRIIANVIYEILKDQLYSAFNKKTGRKILGEEKNAFSDCND